METQEPLKKTTVYVPRSVHERVQVAARKHRRSFNSELIWLLEQALAEVEEHKGKSDATG
jgi:predicted HicB family RNase H-like nuclease